jgi:hypothetical protein
MIDTPGSSSLGRRQFLKAAGMAAVLGAPGDKAAGVSIILDPDDHVAAQAPSRWAAAELERSLAARGIAVARCERLSQAAKDSVCIDAAGPRSPKARQVLKAAQAAVPEVPEALGLVAGKADGRAVLLACGHDERGLIYALLELADRAQYATDPLDALKVPKPVIERPANPIRSVARLFVSEVEDKPWFNDREMWPRYLALRRAPFPRGRRYCSDCGAFAPPPASGDARL